MSRHVELTESREGLVSLSVQEAEALESIGRRLASSKVWWGSVDGSSPASTVIAVSRATDTQWRVTFRDVVGVVSLGDLQIRVVPKIAWSHFSYLLSRSSVAPRVSSESVEMAHGDDLAELLARWFVGEAESVLRKGVRRDYVEYEEELAAVQGTIQVVPTALNLFQGRPQVYCEFSDLGTDSSLNRVLKRAASVVGQSTHFSPATKGRARRVAQRLMDVGEMATSDLRVQIDRNSRQYSRALPLAKLLIGGSGLSDTVGSVTGAAFLLRTPELIEDGVRSVLSELLPDETIRKRQLLLGGSALTINPDLVFEGRQAVGDVKYRKLSRDWDRSHFNQVVTFATGFNARRACILGFTDRSDSAVPKRTKIGGLDVVAFGWSTLVEIEPQAAALKIASELGSWLHSKISAYG